MAHAWQIKYLLERQAKAAELLEQAFLQSGENYPALISSFNRAMHTHNYPFSWAAPETAVDETFDALVAEAFQLYYDTDGHGPRLGHRLGGFLATAKRALPDLENHLTLVTGECCAFTFTRKEFPHMNTASKPCAVENPVFEHNGAYYCCGRHHPLGETSEGGVPYFIQIALHDHNEETGILNKYTPTKDTT